MPHATNPISPRPALFERLLVDPPSWARSSHRILVLALPAIVTIYGIWYDALAAGTPPDLLQSIAFALAGTTLWLGRRWPWATVAAAIACWSVTESCVFVIAASYLLGRWQPRAWWILLGLVALVHPLGLVPDPCAYRAGHTALPPETTPLFAVALPALAGVVVLTSVRLAAVREGRLRADADAAEDRARAVIATDRLRLSQEMHDLLGQRVSRMVLHATAITATTPDDRARELATRIADTGASTVEDLQYIVGVLRETPAESAVETPRPPTALQAVEDAREDGITVDEHGLDQAARLAPDVACLVDAVVTEALHNASKYASGASIAVYSDVRSDLVRLCIENSPGRSVVSAVLAPGGHGLERLRERAREIGAVVAAGPTDCGGFAVTLEVPL